MTKNVTRALEAVKKIEGTELGIGWLSNSITFGDTEEDIDGAVDELGLSKEDATALFETLAVLGQEGKCELYLNDGDDDGYEEKEYWPNCDWESGEEANETAKGQYYDPRENYESEQDWEEDGSPEPYYCDELSNAGPFDSQARVRYFNNCNWYGYLSYAKDCTPEEIELIEELTKKFLER